MKALAPKTKEAVLQIAQWQEGVVETPSGSNRVKYNTVYYGREVSGDSYPWCMAYIWWGFREAGFNMKKTASCSELRAAYEKAGQWVTSGYKPGDIVMFDFSGKRKKTEHCGLVLEVCSGYLITSEGNTGTNSQANGGAVMRRKRELNLVTGACRPGYNL